MAANISYKALKEAGVTLRKIENAFVTGGTGVVGNALIRYLLAKNINVTALVRPNSYRAQFLPRSDKLKIIKADLNSAAQKGMSVSSHEHDVFFHLAWEGSLGDKVANRNDLPLQMKNINMAYEAVQLCKNINCKTFVMTGSQAEFGVQQNVITENNVRNPNTAYGIAKCCAKDITKLFCEINHIRHIWPVLFSVYGLYDETESMIKCTLDAIKKGSKISYTRGEQQWDYLYAKDVAFALLLLAERGRSGESYNVAYGTSRPLAEYIREIYEVANVRDTIRFGEISYDSNRPMNLSADITKLRNETGFEPKYCFRDGIAELIKNLKIS